MSQLLQIELEQLRARVAALEAGGGVTLLDEDDMASDSAVDGATQQSIKAYVDGVGAGGGWQSWPTPSFANFTIGNGAWLGEYLDIGPNLRAVRFKLTMGSTSSWSANIGIPVPGGSFDDAPERYASCLGGECHMLDTSAGTHIFGRWRGQFNSLWPILVTASSTYPGLGGNVTGTVPFTWATGDTLSGAAILAI